jgi:hypothetical protein
MENTENLGSRVSILIKEIIINPFTWALTAGGGGGNISRFIFFWGGWDVQGQRLVHEREW